MKTLGIIGGIAPESTIEYYRIIVSLYQERKPDGSYPPLLINSIDLQQIIRMVTGNQRAELVDFLVKELTKLSRAGAEFALLASNTPHIVFDELQSVSPLPLISIVESACDEAARRGWKKVGLFGTRFTMQAGFYVRVFAQQGIEVVVPELPEQEYIHSHYMDELIRGIFLDETGHGMLRIAQRMQAELRLDGLILGGTELPLLLRGPIAGLPLLDTTRIHAAAAVEQMLA